MKFRQNFEFKVMVRDEKWGEVTIESCEPRMRGKVATANRLQIQTNADASGWSTEFKTLKELREITRFKNVSEWKNSNWIQCTHTQGVVWADTPWEKRNEPKLFRTKWIGRDGGKSKSDRPFAPSKCETIQKQRLINATSNWNLTTNLWCLYEIPSKFRTKMGSKCRDNSVKIWILGFRF